VKAAIGILIVALHLIAYVALAGRSRGTELEVEVRSPLISEKLDLVGTVPVEISRRVVETSDGDRPGLRRKRWRVAYRGGFVREVGATQLVGPFQTANACSGRVIVGQALLDQVAVIMKNQLDEQLRGEEIFPIGKYRSIESLTLEWARFETHPLDATLLGEAGAPHGYVRAQARIVFDRVAVPLTLVAIPETSDADLTFRVQAYAQVEVSNGVLQWINAKVGLTSKLATKIANHEISAMLVTALAPPPPFELDGQEIAFVFCKDPIAVVDRRSGSLPFAVRISGRVVDFHASVPALLPTRSVAIELDVNALNGLLSELWRTGYLDRRLAEIGLDRRFNSDPTVMELLTVRLSPLTLALPPVIEPAGDHLRLSAEARVALTDGAVTVARVFGSVDFNFTAGLGVVPRLDPLELACERTPTTLVPCYADLVASIADRGADFDGSIAAGFSDLLSQIFVARSFALGALPGSLHVSSVVPSLTPGGRGIRLDLDAKLVE
jgi:hypothetical protein